MSRLTRRGLGLGLLAAAAWPAWAQGTPAEGVHYVRLAQPAPVDTPRPQVELLAFFWYGSPACHQFLPALDAWAARLPADVRLRHVPVALRDEPFTAHQRLYYTLDALAQLPALHRKVFQAIHVERRPLASAADIADFAARQGLDSARFAEIYASPLVQARVQRARQLSAGYKIDGVPALGVQGRYFSSAALAGSPTRLLAVGDHLIGLARKG